MSNLLQNNDESSFLPDNLGKMTLNQLINGEDVEVSKKKNVINITKKTDNNVVNLEIRKYDDLMEVSQTSTPTDRKINAKAKTIADMYQDGYTQAEIARKIGSTQPYISKILKECKE